jgi:hypothetical protein
VVHPEVGGEIPDSHIREAVGFAEHDENTDSDSKSKITEEDEFGVLGFVKGAVWVEMVHTSGKPVDHSLSTTFVLTLVVVVTSNIAK